MNMIRESILKKAIDHYGAAEQRDKAIEEMGELIRALARMNDKANIAEEIADVRIMLDQMEMIFGIHVEVRRIENEKLLRLHDRILAGE